MLDDTDSERDTDIVKRWLVDAIAAGARDGKSAAALARYCEVSPQAVNGWVTTGRITKSNLALAAAYFGHAPHFTGVPPVREPDGPYNHTWPFTELDLGKINALTRDERLRLEGAFMLAAAQLGFSLAKEAAA